MKRQNKPPSVQGISAKNMEDVEMYSDGGKQTATASGNAKRIKMDSRERQTGEKKYIWDNWFSQKTKVILTSIIAILFFLATTSSLLGVFDKKDWHSITPSNLLANKGFENGLIKGTKDDWGDDKWRTDDPKHITIDRNHNRGNETSVVLVKLQSTSEDIHLFSPNVDVDYAKVYKIGSNLNLKQLATDTVFGYYIDEYDGSKSWIDGCHLTRITASGAQSVTLIYKPSPNAVFAKLQLIVSKDSNVLAYVDSVKWVESNQSALIPPTCKNH